MAFYVRRRALIPERECAWAQKAGGWGTGRARGRNGLRSDGIDLKSVEMRPQPQGVWRGYLKLPMYKIGGVRSIARHLC
uniref:Uncharacterized protein n=1 Tax=Chromera velia CCMP2878 TaxID=1169474 RepID=A0A0G4FJ21_9ALVE|eukprot:Cvel_3374.t1-p1 / transcript=Cvel_3374.t1 / gene=Cvel_3374 / organism=Chromera_velia_CCMP2878 / gene_product=hypothetical protein / transcript_product=hypothetical protein / location=Cvel_scaffold135:120602-121419(-) / protein_length=78 / sequence_SO=supercontig / SO=protein_coding / is_pseudo=false